jgi:hypothetical protein
MPTVVIPVDPTASFWTQTTTLDGVPYLLTFRYNHREQAYYLSIDSSDGLTTYVQGVKIVSNVPLLETYGATPSGEMMALSVSNSDDSPARLGELGDNVRVALLYFEAADLYALGTEPERNPGP